MKRHWIVIVCGAGGLLLAGCGNNGGGGADTAAPGNPGFVAFTRALAATVPEDAEPIDVDGIAADVPEDQEPEAI